MSDSVLFYSNKCKHSKKAIQIINDNNINIKLVSIDDKNVKLPTFLKVVPTIIQQGIEQPLEGDFVFKWLDTSKTQRSKQLEIPKQGKDDSSIQPFFSNEMSGYSDGYSYLNNETPMNHSFEFLNGSGNIPANKINTSNSTSDKTSDKEDQFNKQYEQLMEQRRGEIPDSVQRS
jgi:hypothetical protein